MRIPFTKMHGNGNDFVVVDDSDGRLALTGEQARRLADRRFGIGCDQVLVVGPAPDAATDVAMHIYNSDGSGARQCGNGLRCVAGYLRDAGRVSADAVRVWTPGGVVLARLLADGRVCVDMGIPQFEPDAVPLVAGARAPGYALRVADGEIVVGAVSMGNPHAVMRVDDVDTAPVERLGPAIQGLALFPEGVNVGFMQVVHRDRVRLRVYERGAGETLACGTGACAAVAVGRVQGLLDERVRVELPGGALEIAWAGDGEPVKMTGPAIRVFDGEVSV